MKKIIPIVLLLVMIIFSAAFSILKPMPDNLLKGEKEADPQVLNMQPLPKNANITRLVVFKSKRQMWAYDKDKLMKIYPVSLGGNPVEHKQFEGDQKTPEGIYRINERNPHSHYHKNLGISYPNTQDKAYAASQGKSAGGLIKIHGLPNRSFDIGRQHLRYD
ncbi:L,D-transpeptidase family protein [Rodentibacter trehalosifermentans]|uniref:L,D-transpeptidase family protein n=1 Tax=Rodentibacter trehalosifermentans TaxID=1908263 RepID=UPI001A962DAC|nr:L,D-transpeptidase family protein [Rodentibacter trehalosifermentans]